MKREIYKRLLEWKGNPYRKPLILNDARQVDKTHASQEWMDNVPLYAAGYALVK